MPSSRFSDFTDRPIFLPKVPEINPLQLWGCQDVASMISASVAPFARRSRSRIVAVLLLARTPSASGFAPFGALAVALAGVAFLVLDAAAGLG